MLSNATRIALLRRRATALADEIRVWDAAATSDKAYSIHRSQIFALKEMMSVLFERQRALLTALSPAAPFDSFAADVGAIEREIVGANDLWRTFRTALDQRRDAAPRAALDAADLTAADCYLGSMRRAAAWKVVDEDRFREPPLTLLDARYTPATAPRATPVSAAGLATRVYKDMRLPVPLLLLPFDQIGGMWHLTAIHHEVGHDLDQDLGLRGGLAEALGRALGAASVPDARRAVWGGWVPELLGDAVGVLLGGAGFGASLASLLAALGAGRQIAALDDPHPDSTLRVALLAALLRAASPALATAADAILTDYGPLTKPAGIEPYVPDLPAVAAALLDTKLAGLSGHALRELGDDLAADDALARQIAAFLSGTGQRPNLLQTPARLVAPAAYLAIDALDDANDAALTMIHQRALQLIQSIPRPQFLSGASRRAFLRELVQQITF